MKPEIVIIGGGPAGIAAAIQLKRFGLVPFIVERDRIGGLLHAANLVENYPGFPGGIAGADLAALFEQQLHIHQVPVICDEVTELSASDTNCVVRTFGGRTLQGLVIVATGTEPIPHPTVNVAADLVSRIGYDIEPLRELRNRRIVILGGGDAAFDYALQLACHNRVTIVYRAEKSTALPLLQHRVRANPSIVVFGRTLVTQVRATDAEAISLALESPTGSTLEVCDYVLMALGRRPSLHFISDEAQNINHVSEAPLYFAGDVVNGHYRQTAIAVGDGLRVAMQICERFSASFPKYAVTL